MKNTLFEEDLTYTIRFQNTGNAEAYDVVIRDTLSSNLDLSTFHVLGSSHNEVLTTSMTSEGFLTFEFKNIFLPDSTTNFDASQGYVSYLISPIEGLDENTSIENSAGIYFDFNPPVATNTVENIMVSELPTPNVAPSSQSFNITTEVNTSYYFNLSDFTFSDTNGDELAHLVITSLPNNGQLLLNGNPIGSGFGLAPASIDELYFVPTANETGEPYTSFEFLVSDGIEFSQVYLVTVNVVNNNTAPSSENFTITTNENTAYSFSENDFTFTDVDGDEFLSLHITSLPTKGLLKLNNIEIVNNQEVAATDISQLQFTPNQNEFGEPYTSFDFTVSDGINFSEAYTTLINVNNTTYTTEQLQNINISLSPNPTAGRLHLTIQWENLPSPFTIKVIDMSGKEIYLLKEESSTLEYHREFNFEQLAKGTYFLWVEMDNTYNVEKFILE